MTRVTDAIDAAVQDAQEADRRRRAERDSVRTATAEPRSDIARGLRTIASALRGSKAAS